MSSFFDPIDPREYVSDAEEWIEQNEPDFYQAIQDIKKEYEAGILVHAVDAKQSEIAKQYVGKARAYVSEKLAPAAKYVGARLAQRLMNALPEKLRSRIPTREAFDRIQRAVGVIDPEMGEMMQTFSDNFGDILPAENSAAPQTLAGRAINVVESAVDTGMQVAGTAVDAIDNVTQGFENLTNRMGLGVRRLVQWGQETFEDWAATHSSVQGEIETAAARGTTGFSAFQRLARRASAFTQEDMLRVAFEQAGATSSPTFSKLLQVYHDLDRIDAHANLTESEGYNVRFDRSALEDAKTRIKNRLEAERSALEETTGRKLPTLQKILEEPRWQEANFIPDIPVEALVNPVLHDAIEAYGGQLPQGAAQIAETYRFLTTHAATMDDPENIEAATNVRDALGVVENLVSEQVSSGLISSSEGNALTAPMARMRGASLGITSENAGFGARFRAVTRGFGARFRNMLPSFDSDDMPTTIEQQDIPMSRLDPIGEFEGENDALETAMDEQPEEEGEDEFFDALEEQPAEEDADEFFDAREEQPEEEEQLYSFRDSEDMENVSAQQPTLSVEENMQISETNIDMAQQRGFTASDATINPTANNYYEMGMAAGGIGLGFANLGLAIESGNKDAEAMASGTLALGIGALKYPALGPVGVAVGTVLAVPTFIDEIKAKNTEGAVETSATTALALGTLAAPELAPLALLTGAGLMIKNALDAGLAKRRRNRRKKHAAEAAAKRKAAFESTAKEDIVQPTHRAGDMYPSSNRRTF